MIGWLIQGPMIGGPVAPSMVALDSLIKMEVASNSQEIKDGHGLHYAIHDHPLATLWNTEPSRIISISCKFQESVAIEACAQASCQYV